jgi:hypothetical protein
MIRFTWLQFRAQVVSAAAVLAAAAALLAVTGPHLASLYAASGITGCHGASCGQLAASFLNLLGGGLYLPVYLFGLAAVILAPALIGIFWGAPLIARELETGTFRMAWTQSITRTRWLAVKLTLTGLAAMAVTEGLSLMQAWWAAPIGQAARLASGRSFPLGLTPFSLLVFDAHGITPLGYAAFAFTLGATAGILLRRAVPAMALTLAIFAAAQLAFPLAVRAHLFSPDHTTIALSSIENSNNTNFRETGRTFAVTTSAVPGQPGAWIISSGMVNTAGQPISALLPACVPGQDQVSCMASHGTQVAVSYQPTSRYWAFQVTETAIYLALALALAGYCFWRVRRRLS